MPTHTNSVVERCSWTVVQIRVFFSSYRETSRKDCSLSKWKVPDSSICRRSMTSHLMQKNVFDWRL